MAISIDWPSAVITVPRADMTLVQSTPIEVRELNIDTFRLTLKDLEDDFTGMGFTKTHNHNTIVEISGIQLARVVEILPPYTITFEDGSYAVNLVGANSNIGDRVNLNSVSIRASNSAGLVQTSEIQYSSFQNTVFIDVINGTAGNAYPLGTASDPVDNLNDAKFIANLRGFTTISIVGNLTIGATANVDDYILQGEGATFNNPKTTVTMSGGCSTSNTAFHDCKVDGVQGGESIYHHCVIGNITNTHCKFSDCGMVGPVEVVNSGWTVNHTTDLKDCYTSSSWYNLDYNNSPLQQVYTNFSGKFKLSNFTQASANLIMQLDSGEVWLDSTCTGSGSVVIRGIGTLIDNSSLTNVVTDGLMNKDTVATAVGDEIGSEIQYSSFNGGVTVDISAGTSGTLFPIGTPSNPVSNIPDAMFIANSRGFPALYIIGNIILGSGDIITNMMIEGQDQIITTITVLDAADVTNSKFQNCKITGILDGGNIIMNAQTTGDLYYVNGYIWQCLLNPGTIYLDGGATAHFMDCWSGQPGSGTPTIDMGGSGQSLGIRGYNGGIKIQNKTGSDAISVDLNSGQIILDATVTSGDIQLRGVGMLTDNSPGTADISTDGLMSKDTIAGAVWDQTQTLKHIVESTRGTHAAFGHVIYWDPYGGDDLLDGTNPDNAVKTFEIAKTHVHQGDSDVIFALATDPSGVTTVSGNIVIDIPTLQVRGPGESLTIYTTSGTGVSILSDAVGFEGFKVQGVGDHVHGEHCVLVSGSINFKLKNLYLTYGRDDGIHIVDCARGIMDTLNVMGCKHYGIHVNNVSYCELQGINIVHYCGLAYGQGSGIFIDDSSHGFHIHEGTEVHNCGGYGIHTASGTQETFVHPGTRLFSNGLGNYLSDGSEDSIGITIGTEPLEALTYRVEGLRNRAPAQGRIIYYDPVLGSDTNDGHRPDRAKGTFAGAHDIVVDGRHDIIQILDNNPVHTSLELDEQWVITKSDLSVRGPGWDLLLSPTTTSGATIMVTGEEVSLEQFQVRTSSSGSNQSCIIITSDNCNINNVKIKRGTHAGVMVDNADNLYMKGCLVEHFTTGSGYGICIMGDSHENTFADNFVYDCNYNIHVMGTAHENTLKGNVLHDALIAGLKLEAGSTHTYIHSDNIIANNAIDIIDNAEGTYYHALYNADLAADRVWDHLAQEHTASGTFGHILKHLNHVPGVIFVDSEVVINGIGSQEEPFNNIADAIDEAESHGMHTICLYSDIILDRQLKNYKFLGVGIPTVDTNGQNLDRSEFGHVKLQGSYTGSITVQESVLLNNFTLNGYFENCGLAGDLVCASNGSILIKDCASLIPGLPRPTISMNSGTPSSVGLRNYSGGMTIKNCDHSGDVITVEMAQGSLTFDSSCTNGEMVARGLCKFIDEAAGAAVTDETVWRDSIGHAVWDDLIADHTTSGTTGHSLGMASAGGVDYNLLSDAVWDESSSEHTTSGTMGGSLNTASVGGVDLGLLADAVWDESLTGGSHNIPNSAGRRLRESTSSIIVTGTAIGPGINNNQIQLDNDASTQDGAYDPAGISIVAGTGTGQSRGILEYTGSTKTATVDRSWKVTPDNTSAYIVYGWVAREHVNEGLARGAASDTLQLNTYASTVSGTYAGQTVFIRSGTGEDQSASIKVYDGVSQTITIEHPWTTLPDTTSAYVILAQHQHVVEHIGEAVWDVATTYPTVSGSMGTKFNELTDNVERALGLVQENYYIDNTTYTEYNGAQLMTAGRMRTYSESASVGTDNNVIAIYNIEASWTNDQMDSYKVTKV